MHRRAAAAMAVVGFALTCLLGAIGGQSVEYTLGRALLAMLVFFLIGLGVGWAAELLLREHFSDLTRTGGEDAQGEGGEQAPADDQRERTTGRKPG